MFNQCPIPFFYNNNPAPRSPATASLCLSSFSIHSSLHTVGTPKCVSISASSEMAFCSQGLQASTEKGRSVGREPRASEKGFLRWWFFERQHILDTLRSSMKTNGTFTQSSFEGGGDTREEPSLLNIKRNSWMKVRGWPLRRVPLPAGWKAFFTKLCDRWGPVLMSILPWPQPPSKDDMKQRPSEDHAEAYCVFRQLL